MQLHHKTVRNLYSQYSCCINSCRLTKDGKLKYRDSFINRPKFVAGLKKAATSELLIVFKIKLQHFKLQKLTIRMQLWELNFRIENFKQSSFI